MVTKTPISGQRDIVHHIIASDFPIDTLLDIGTGNGAAARLFRDAGIKVTATGFDIDEYSDHREADFEGIDLFPDVDICDMSVFPDDSFGAIWCAHVLEHVLDTGRALQEIRRILKPDGYFFVSVPPFKHEVVGGHIHPGWNPGILMYVLAVSGFDLSVSSFIRHGYNVCGLVRNGPDLWPNIRLHFSNGDIETLQRHGRFPEGFDAKQGFDGNFKSFNWHWLVEPEFKATPFPMQKYPEK
ncbi:bifunctional 2-polyprenyl-6-hydroxyphenol methylase/3-demethylubiquinol 3-O-methyltransferase UbiG [Roseibium sp. RKSG952]|uniref:class I SAM-dependent methyltransferase n=1 Tax=Roseibium sp. RKSG952 TaxID=2529384 RepID=UPI0012BB84A6|nr:class I SAM-dependent methyltransferase [Roseibium sp. RKSG952]